MRWSCTGGALRRGISEDYAYSSEGFRSSEDEELDEEEFGFAEVRVREPERGEEPTSAFEGPITENGTIWPLHDDMCYMTRNGQWALYKLTLPQLLKGQPPRPRYGIPRAELMTKMQQGAAVVRAAERPSHWHHARHGRHRRHGQKVTVFLKRNFW